MSRQEFAERALGPSGKFLRARAGSQPLGQLSVESPQGQRACAGDGMTPAAQGLALSSPPRARAAGVPQAALRQCASTAPCRSCTTSPGQPSSTRWSAPREQSALRRISPESQRGSRLRPKAPPADLWPGACQAAGPKYFGARARCRPRRGVGYQFVSSVAPSLCPTFFSVASPRESHYTAPPRELSCELCAVCGVSSSPDPVLRPVTACLVSAPEPIVCSVCVRVGPSSMLGGV